MPRPTIYSSSSAPFHFRKTYRTALPSVTLGLKAVVWYAVTLTTFGASHKYMTVSFTLDNPLAPSPNSANRLVALRYVHLYPSTHCCHLSYPHIRKVHPCKRLPHLFFLVCVFHFCLCSCRNVCQPRNHAVHNQRTSSSAPFILAPQLGQK